MNEHLKSAQIAQCIVGGASAAERQHSRECPQCAAELAELESSLSRFRDSVQAWSARQSASRPHAWGLADALRPFPSHRLRLLLAMAAMVVLAVVPLYRGAMERQRRHAEMAREDAILMERVDDQISRSVPASMEPLAKLMSTSSEGDK